jgi:PAS domain S-box-containing protein
MSDSNGRILIVDDDPEALRLSCSLLEKEGFRVQPADTGKLALASVCVEPPELILLDVRMPGMDGFEVCARLKESEQGRRIPVMFISSTRDTNEWAKGLAMGAVDFVSKPFQRDELLARIRTHIELARLRNDLEARVEQRTADFHNALEQLQSALERLEIEVEERRQSELEARESEWRFRRVANSAPVIIWTSDETNHVDFRNEYAAVFTGVPMEEMSNANWDEVIHPDDRQTVKRAYAQNMEAGHEFEIEYRVRRADGEYRRVLDKGTPRYRQDGQFPGFVGIIIDLTDIKQSQERAFAAQTLNSLRVLSAGLAHDFNTMLGAVLGEADLALSDLPPDSSVRENLDRIVALTKRSTGIVRLLSAYAGDPSAIDVPRPVNLTKLVQEVVPHLKTSISRQAEIRMQLEPDLPLVIAKTLQMRQVVLNLILYAVEALGQGKGIVTVRTSRAYYSTGETDIWPDVAPGNYVRLEVSDTGRGMTEDIASHMFDPSYGASFPGRGMGLAAVQGIIRSFGAIITIRSTPGLGSTFETLWPCAPEGVTVDSVKAFAARSHSA